MLTSHIWRTKEVMLSKDLRVKPFGKVGYHGLVFLSKIIKWVTESYLHRANVSDYGE